tara:strand:+ start:50 stop:586 length:537 start_codon:yes stop_codon:yes gene_type:complete
MKKSKTGRNVGIAIVLYFVAVVAIYDNFTPNNIFRLQPETEEQSDYIDTVFVDTLEANDTLLIAVPQINTLVDAMIQVESSGDDSAYCASENAAGCLQIRPIMVSEVNRILRRRGLDSTYTLQDRWSRESSLEMLNIYLKHYKIESFEEIARCWNGGPSGMSYSSTEGYWERVQNKMI